MTPDAQRGMFAARLWWLLRWVGHPAVAVLDAKGRHFLVAATTGEVQDLRREARALKECVADLTLENRLLKKSMTADGGDDE